MAIDNEVSEVLAIKDEEAQRQTPPPPSSPAPPWWSRSGASAQSTAS